MNEPQQPYGAQFICFACATPLLEEAGLSMPGPIWCHIAKCELCSTIASVSKARNFGLPAHPKPENWNYTT